MNYAEATAYLERVPKFTKKNKPENTEELLRRIGHPERGMKVIHVAGTNGKGSVCAFLSSILVTAGKRTGLFTSPHLVSLTERFQINGRQIAEEVFARAFTGILQVTNEMMKDGFAHPAYFELLFATGLLIFQEAGVEYLVLETGLGGRLDATNLVEHPIACVITSIGMDHMEILGDTVEEIASEKAGILKPGVPVIYDGRDPKVDQVITERVEKLQTEKYRYDESMSQILRKTDKNIDFLLDIGYDEKINVTVPFPAPYQVINSSLALLTVRVIDPARTISEETVLEGIRRTRWPGRMETVLPRVVLEGAHNVDGIRELIRTIRGMQGKQQITLLFAAVAEKEYRKMIRELCEGIPLFAVVVTEVGGTRCVPAKELAEVFRTYTDAPVTEEPDVESAFSLALEKQGNGMLYCVGSLYLAGRLKEILKEHGHAEL